LPDPSVSSQYWKACEPVSFGLNNRISQLGIEIWPMAMCDVMWCDEIRWDMSVAISSISSHYWGCCEPLSVRLKNDDSQLTIQAGYMSYENMWCDKIRYDMSVPVASISNHYWGALSHSHCVRKMIAVNRWRQYVIWSIWVK